MPAQSSKQVVCITGASAGIGAAVAEEFAKAGHHLVLGARRLEKLEQLKSQLAKLGAASVLTLALDVTKEASVQEFAAHTLRQHKGVDVLVNNAGLAKGTDPLAKGASADWQVMIDTNIMGALLVARAFLPAMLERNSGHIINMGSVAGLYVYAGGAVYAATKHALRAISETLRLELNGTPIRVSEIEPGMVETEFSMVRFQDE